MDGMFSYTSALMETCDDGELQQRLNLYQVFLKLYEHHQGLLNEILSLEHSGSKALASVTVPYIQGVVLGQDVHLVTNLVQSKTRALFQPQHTWIIGRNLQRAGIPIQDKRLSRFHAAIRYVNEQGFYLIDLDSRNGSFVNGELIRHPTFLKDGDRVRLGSLTFSFFLCQSAERLNPIAADLFTPLENRQISPPPRRFIEQDPVEDPTEIPPDPSTPTISLEDTYMFMRLGQMNRGASLDD